ncbi:MAG: 50S ribosomal protein L31 [Parcubacteria group bacterium]|nr:50S ribosomal protein L31 [Parcubacteria group bacterium]
MKKNIHPQYHDNATITCTCGQVFKVGGAVVKTEVEICSHCHPFYTGEKKLIDTAGRVEKFKARTQKKKEAPKKKARIRIKKKS